MIVRSCTPIGGPTAPPPISSRERSGSREPLRGVVMVPPVEGLTERALAVDDYAGGRTLFAGLRVGPGVGFAASNHDNWPALAKLICSSFGGPAVDLDVVAS